MLIGKSSNQNGPWLRYVTNWKPWPPNEALWNGGTAPDIKSPGGCLDCIVTATWAFSSTTSNCGKVTCFGAHQTYIS